MDQERAGQISALYQKATTLNRRIKDYQVKVGCVGTTTITVDCSMLPAIIQLTEAQLAEVEAKIDEM